MRDHPEYVRRLSPEEAYERGYKAGWDASAELSADIHSASAIRDEFATAAMEGTIASQVKFSSEQIAIDAYAIADAMMREREPKPPGKWPYTPGQGAVGDSPKVWPGKP